MNHNIGGLLKTEFLERKKKNTAYSLRAFSRDLGISSSFLSDVLKGKKKLSPDKALSISQSIGWSWRETQLFLQTAQLSQTKTHKAKNFLQKEIQKTQKTYYPFKNLKIHQFSPVSDWYYMAILELTSMKEFTASAEWLSKRLGLDKKVAAAALEKLKKSGLLYEDEFGRWTKNDHSLPSTPSADIRKFHRQQLTNAAKAIEEQDFHKRSFSGVTLAIDSAKLPQAVELIREFRSRMTHLLTTGEKDSVYHLAVQLFQLDPASAKSEKTPRQNL